MCPHPLPGQRWGAGHQLREGSGVNPVRPAGRARGGVHGDFWKSGGPGSDCKVPCPNTHICRWRLPQSHHWQPVASPGGRPEETVSLLVSEEREGRKKAETGVRAVRESPRAVTGCALPGVSRVTPTPALHAEGGLAGTPARPPARHCAPRCRRFHCSCRPLAGFSAATGLRFPRSQC